MITAAIQLRTARIEVRVDLEARTLNAKLTPTPPPSLPARKAATHANQD